MPFAYAAAFCLALREWYVCFRYEKDSPYKGYVNDRKKKL